MNHGREADTLSYVEEDIGKFFRSLHGRKMPSLSETYPLPVDVDEEKRQHLHHRLIQFIFSGKNYMGPVKGVLQFGEKRRILDLGTGKGYWAIDMADEFPRADVLGVDMAPIQPEYVPPNCQFEICNLEQSTHLPYRKETFDLIHARAIHIGIQDYPRLVKGIGQLLKPGGLVLLIEPDLFPATAVDFAGDTTRGIASPGLGGEQPQQLRPHSPSGPVGAPSSPGGSSHRGNAANSTGNPMAHMGLARVTASTGSNSAGISAAQGAEETSAGATSTSEFASPMTRSPPHSPQEQQRSDTDTTPIAPSCLASRTPTKRGTTINRHHLDFILNHTRSKSPRPRSRPASRPRPALADRRSTPTPPSSLPLAGGGPTTNPRRVGFIPNHVPESSPPCPASYPRSSLDDGRNTQTPASPGAQNPRAEPSTAAEGPTAPPTAAPPIAPPGWSKLWATFRNLLEDRPRCVDVTVPSRLGDILASTGLFEDIVVKRANVPVGFWSPRADPTMLTIGQLQWMDYDLLVPALQPFFLSGGMSAKDVEQIIEDAQRDLYYPDVPLLAHIHISYATKKWG